MSSTQLRKPLRRSARIATRREASTLGATVAFPESSQPPPLESSIPTAQDAPEGDCSSNNQTHVEEASNTSSHKTLWRPTFIMCSICFQIAILARIVLFMCQWLPRGEYHDISLLNDLLNAAITQSVLSHILTYHDLQPLLAAHKSFHLPIHDSVLGYARYQGPSSLVPTGSPWLFSPVPKRYLINNTEHDHTETPFDMIPWKDFHRDLVNVFETISDDLVWFAKNASASDLFTKVANTRRATKNMNTDKIYDFEFSESSTNSSIRMDEAIPWRCVNRSLPCDVKTIWFDSLLNDLNRTIETAIYWLHPREDRLTWWKWQADTQAVISWATMAFNDRLYLWEEFGIWLGIDRSGMPNSDEPRIECLKRHNSSRLDDAFEACDKFIPSTVGFASAQVQNSTAQDLIRLITVGSLLMSETGSEKPEAESEKPEAYLPNFRSHLEELKSVTKGLIQHVEDVLFYFDTPKMADQMRETWHEDYRSRIECRLARLDKTLPFLREVALTRIEDQIERTVLALLVVKDVNAQRQSIQEAMHSLQSSSSWILPPHPRSSWRGWLQWMMGLAPYTSGRLVFPSLKRMLADSKKAASWVQKLADYDHFLGEELSGTFEVAKLKYEKSYALLSSELGLAQCKARMVSRWHAADQGQRLDAYAYDGNNCFLHPCVDEMEATERIVGVHDGWWDRLTGWMY
ncbi:unnamed protein product [Clonostachys rosea]|uniref:Uncharacterized protein n=1 Tax=Bionectria ochroleuca TaxID=29856 RepID=A0ABY6U9R3_BIOOC|nr:unnamed protein product [Clonostachys rosea]